MNTNEMKELYHTGDYVCYVKDERRGWKKINFPTFAHIYSTQYTLIHKRDAHIAEIAKGNSVRIEWLNPHIGMGQRWEIGDDFFRKYNPELTYRIKESKPFYDPIVEHLHNTPTETISIGDGDKTEHFAKFGFEVPDFECELLKEYLGIIVGTVLLTDGTRMAVGWEINGRAIAKDKKYDLTPLQIKVEEPRWYDLIEDWSCGVPIVDNDTNCIYGIGYNKYKNNIENYNGNILINDITCGEFRLATKTERDNLFCLDSEETE